MSRSDCHWMLNKPAIPSIFLLCFWNLATGQLRYSIPEEQEPGALVGNIAQDLGLNVEELTRRKFRIVSDSPAQNLNVDLKSGLLIVEGRIDREQLCGQSSTCLVPVQVVIENPVEQYRVDVEILDINDNPPRFPVSEIRLEIAESAIPGTRFLLQNAHDSDVQANSLRTYQLTPNDHFSLDVQFRGETKLPELKLDMSLDREEQSEHSLLLTALDGGSPMRTGTTHVIINVLDINDNAPVFEQSLYVVNLTENVSSGSLVIKLNATDLDEGSNDDIVYSFSSYNKERIRELFSIDAISGEIRVSGMLDFEEVSTYDIDVEAKDKSSYPLSTHCNVRVNIKDLNDNAPNITLNSIAKEVREDASRGTLIALINVKDKDSHENAYVDCRISPNLPFVLKSSFKNSYMLVLNDPLDRERASEYKIVVTCYDRGNPPLTSNANIVVHVSDINDNAPRFLQPSYTIYVMENNAPGNSIGVVRAFDPDVDENSHLSYSIEESEVKGTPISSYVSINSKTGVIYSQKKFDYEQLKHFQVHIQAQDGGVPLLSSNTTANVIILDQNDNPPIIKMPKSMNYPQIAVPRSAAPRHLTAKIIASDADSGQNARLFYQIVQATDLSLFTVSHNSGEVRTARHFKDSDDISQKLVIQVSDSGHPPLSGTVTLTISVAEQSAEIRSNFAEPHEELENVTDLAFHIVITLGVLSFILLAIIVVLIALIWPVNRHIAFSRRCVRCCWASEFETKNRFQGSNVNLQIVPDPKVIANVLEVEGNGSVLDAYQYKLHSAPQVGALEYMVVVPFSPGTSGINARNSRPTLAERDIRATNDWLTKMNKLVQVFYSFPTASILPAPRSHLRVSANFSTMLPVSLPRLWKCTINRHDASIEACGIPLVTGCHSEKVLIAKPARYGWDQEEKSLEKFIGVQQHLWR
ncbi:protocadherin alpha-C2-like [Chiloscyllium punctatum]|uniref:protocadherin alpha-C2-like n=1 Tax=Chiloscyllium punctatum TaxID=137246 RepID=UPI003B6352D9